MVYLCNVEIQKKGGSDDVGLGSLVFVGRMITGIGMGLGSFE